MHTNEQVFFSYFAGTNLTSLWNDNSIENNLVNQWKKEEDNVVNPTNPKKAKIR